MIHTQTYTYDVRPKFLVILLEAVIIEATVTNGDKIGVKNK